MDIMEGYKMITTIKQFFCGLIIGHRLNNTDRKCKYNEEDKTLTITESCCKCGKKFTFTSHEGKFGL